MVIDATFERRWEHPRAGSDTWEALAGNDHQLGQEAAELLSIYRSLSAADQRLMRSLAMRWLNKRDTSPAIEQPRRTDPAE